jgi:hypothetical protein
MKNSWGTNFKKGDKVKVIHPRGGNYMAVIRGFETKGAFVKSYGKRVILESGQTASIDDLVLMGQEEKGQTFLDKTSGISV